MSFGPRRVFPTHRVRFFLFFRSILLVLLILLPCLGTTRCHHPAGCVLHAARMMPVRDACFDLDVCGSMAWLAGDGTRGVRMAISERGIEPVQYRLYPCCRSSRLGSIDRQSRLRACRCPLCRMSSHSNQKVAYPEIVLWPLGSAWANLSSPSGQARCA